MTGIERLRELSGKVSDVGRDYKGGFVVTTADELRDICDQIESEAEAPFSRMRVLAVATDMKLHVSGVEGMQDSPVARWARELRAALGGEERDPSKDVSMSAYDLLPQEDREAIAWVREHGGLGHVKDICHDFRAVVERLGIEWSESELHGLMDVLDKRLMPEGMEWLVEAWPRFEDDAPVRIGDEYECWCGETHKANSITIREGSSVINATNAHSFVVSDGPTTAHGERVKRPTPKVPAFDGKPLRVGETVWHEDGTELRVLGFLHEEDDETIVKVERVSGPTKWCECRSLSLTHERPDSYDALWEDIEACAVGYEGFMRRAKALAGGA